MSATKRQELTYRPNVGVMLTNPEGLVWVGKRMDSYNDAWQMPQGGVDKGEDLEVAALRELEEETGIPAANVEILRRTEEWVAYDFPDEILEEVGRGKWRGQKQHWFLMRFLGSDQDVNLDHHVREFSDWKWCDIDDLVPQIVEFKRDVYVEVVRQFRDHLA